MGKWRNRFCSHQVRRILQINFAFVLQTFQLFFLCQTGTSVIIKLNMYNFHKLREAGYESHFHHDCFRRDNRYISHNEEKCWQKLRESLKRRRKNMMIKNHKMIRNLIFRSKSIFKTEVHIFLWRNLQQWIKYWDQNKKLEGGIKKRDVKYPACLCLRKIATNRSIKIKSFYSKYSLGLKWGW